MTWTYYKKPMTWYPIAGGLELFGIANNLKDFVNNSMKSQNLKLNASGRKLGKVDIRREIFQGDSLSPLLFVLCMIPLTWLLRGARADYRCGNKGFKLIHLPFMDDLKWFAKSKNQIDFLVLRNLEKRSVEYLSQREEKWLEQMKNLYWHMDKT